MELKDIFRNSSNQILEDNKELLEEHDLINILGSPNKLFLKFLNSKNLNINEDEITEDLIDEFENSLDSINLKLAKIKRQKEIIFKERRVWINVAKGDEWIGTDLHLHHDSITIDETKEKILYTEIDEIEISDGGWSKNRFRIITCDDEIEFEINEEKAIPLKEILEDNIAHQNHDEFDDLLELLGLYEDGVISKEEYELRKAIIYSDDRYCTNCGFKLDKDCEYCPDCGHLVDE
ncbi:MAG: zinc ribbon domain-containing protein [Methanobrevibacter sp.]|nr:zinc ribbon domain-containing protein [Methanobrevibacter sp.]